MSALSLQINRTCSNNPDLGLCKVIDIVAPIIFIFFTIALPFLIYESTFKNERFKNDNKETKLAKLSLWSCISVFMIGTLLQLFRWIPESIPIFNYSFIPLLGIIPLLTRTNRDSLSNSSNETIPKFSKNEKVKLGVAIIIVLMGIYSIAWLMLNP